MENVVPFRIYEPGLLFGVAAPQQEYQPFPGFVEPGDHPVCKALPPFVLMATGLVRPHRKGSIEQ